MTVPNIATKDLTIVPNLFTMPLACSFEGRIPDAILFAEQGAAPARGFANRSRAASGITPCGTTTAAGGAFPALGQERAGNAR